MAKGAVLITSASACVTLVPLADKLASYLTLSEAEIAFLTELHEPRRKITRHREVIVAGRRYRPAFHSLQWCRVPL